MRQVVTLLAALALGACGLRPLYGGGVEGQVGATLRSVDVAPIPGRTGNFSSFSDFPSISGTNVAFSAMGQRASRRRGA